MGPVHHHPGRHPDHLQLDQLHPEESTMAWPMHLTAAAPCVLLRLPCGPLVIRLPAPSRPSHHHRLDSPGPCPLACHPCLLPVCHRCGSSGCHRISSVWPSPASWMALCTPKGKRKQRCQLHLIGVAERICRAMTIRELLLLATIARASEALTTNICERFAPLKPSSNAVAIPRQAEILLGSAPPGHRDLRLPPLCKVRAREVTANDLGLAKRSH